MKQDEADELLKWSVLVDGDLVVVALDGEMDLSNAPSLRTALREILDARPARVAVELSDLLFLDSSGIRCLVNTAKEASEVGCEFVVCNPASTVRRVMELTGVVELLLTHSNGAAAETH